MDTLYVIKSVSITRCPLYSDPITVRFGELRFELSPPGPMCVILSRELSELSVQLMADPKALNGKTSFSCGGCTGVIKFVPAAGGPEKLIPVDPKIMSLARNLSYFDLLAEADLVDFVRAFEFRSFRQKEYIIHEKESQPRMYIILSGSVQILRAGCKIAVVQTGEVVGELSYITAQPASSSVQALEETLTLCITQDNLQTLLEKSSVAKAFFISVISARLHSLLNVSQAAGFSGSLAEVPLSEVLQLCNQGAKTGVLELELDNSSAQMLFRNGAIVRADYGPIFGKDAFFLILKGSSIGWFSFTSGEVSSDLAPISDFMGLLLEGLQKVDEEE